MKSFIVVAVIAALFSEGSCFFRGLNTLNPAVTTAQPARGTPSNILPSSPFSAQGIFSSSNNAAKNVVSSASGAGTQALNQFNRGVQAGLNIPSTATRPFPSAPNPVNQVQNGFSSAIPSITQAAQQGAAAAQQNVASFLTGLVGNAQQQFENAKQIYDQLNPSAITESAKQAVSNAKGVVGNVQSVADVAVAQAEQVARNVLGQANAAIQETLSDLPSKMKTILINAENMAKFVLEKIQELKQGQGQQAVNAGMQIISASLQGLDNSVGNYGAVVHNMIKQGAGQVQNILQLVTKVVDQVQKNVN